METEARLKELDNHSDALQRLNQRLDIILTQLDWKLDTKPVSASASSQPKPSRNIIRRNARRKSKQICDSVMWCQSREQKLKNYQEAVKLSTESARIYDDEGMPSGTMANLSVEAKSDGRASTMSLSEMTKLKRDLKRRRMRHRTTKAPPLSHTEELRGLIELQMEAWQQFVQQDDKKTTK